MAKKLAFDRWLFFAIVALVCVGLVEVYSASDWIAAQTNEGNPFLFKQAIAAAVGLFAMLVAMHIDYRELKRQAVVYALFGGVLFLLVAALFSPALNQTHRWLFVGGVSIQPSELAKIGLILFLAYQIDRKEDRIATSAFLLPAFGATALAVGLIMVQPDYGTAVMVFCFAMLLIFLGGLPWRYLFIGGAVALPALVAFAMSAPYRMRRLTSFFDPTLDPTGSGFQALQSLIAVGSGGLWGAGPGESAQKLFFLPYAHSDYIFAIVCEELGLFGALSVLGLFGIILWRGVRAGFAVNDTFGRYLAWGLTSVLVVQALVHASIALALLPSTGVPMPFLSYGGSSMVVSLTAGGVLLNISQHG